MSDTELLGAASAILYTSPQVILFSSVGEHTQRIVSACISA